MCCFSVGGVGMCGVVGCGGGGGVVGGVWMGGKMVLIAQWMPLGATDGRHSIVAHLFVVVAHLASFLFLFLLFEFSFRLNFR